MTEFSEDGNNQPAKPKIARRPKVKESSIFIQKKKSRNMDKTKAESLLTPPDTIPFFPPRIKIETTESCCNATVEDATLDHRADHHAFAIKTLAWAIQNQLSTKCIERYINKFTQSQIRTQMCFGVYAGFGVPNCPILFFAIEQNSPELIRLLCKAGALVGQRATPSDLPPLAYAVLSAEYNLVDTTDVLITLLATGADPKDIPEDMWQSPLKSPVKDIPDHQVGEKTANSWCTKEVRGALARTLNLMQRYALWKASSFDKPTDRMLQIAEAHDLLPLLETPFHLIGQKVATQHILRKILNHYLFKDKKPLILLLTGPSGHGKTELAKRMGSLLSLKIHQVDCTEMAYETDILGPKAPYYGYEEGSPLNNHLAEHDGQKTVIFMDEFDKTTKAVYQAMLLPFESGFYNDRRNGKKLDCTNHIWLLAANLGEDIIRNFWKASIENKTLALQEKAPLAALQKTLRARAIEQFGAPLTGRLREVVPYLPFDDLEQAVAAYKFMREIRRKVRADINTDAKDFAGHSYINFIDDGQLALHIAKEGYIPELGARSLDDAVDREVTDKLGDIFLRQPSKIDDAANKRALDRYDVKIARASDGTEEVKVTLAGVQAIMKDTKTTNTSQLVDWNTVISNLTPSTPGTPSVPYTPSAPAFASKS